MLIENDEIRNLKAMILINKTLCTEDVTVLKL